MSMLFQSAHVEACGLTLSEVEPSPYVKVVVDDSDCAKDWLICKIGQKVLGVLALIR